MLKDQSLGMNWKRERVIATTRTWCLQCWSYEEWGKRSVREWMAGDPIMLTRTNWSKTEKVFQLLFRLILNFLRDVREEVYYRVWGNAILLIHASRISTFTLQIKIMKIFKVVARPILFLLGVRKRNFFLVIMIFYIKKLIYISCKAFCSLSISYLQVANFCVFEKVSSILYIAHFSNFQEWKPSHHI